MNEVEKMYRNAHVYPRVYGDITKETFENKVFNMGDICNEAFTAEKQLELIKWLMCKKQTIQVELRLYENDYCISHITECEHNDAVEYVETGRKNTFDEALADLVNELWQDLTKEERKQIKEILE